MLLRWLPSIAILIGLISQVGYNTTWIIQPCLALIMLSAFIETRGLAAIKINIPQIRLILVQASLGLMFFFLFSFVYEPLAFAVLILAITPTAVSSVAVATSLDADVSIVATSVVLTNLSALVLFPLSHFFLSSEASISIDWIETFQLLTNTILIPLLISLVFLKFFGRYTTIFKTRVWHISIRLIWTIILGVSASRISHWYTSVESLFTIEILLPMVTALIGFLLFIAIAKILIKQDKLEAKIYGTQKNTGLALLFTISLHLQPAAALILSYALIQNLYFSYLTSRR